MAAREGRGCDGDGRFPEQRRRAREGRAPRSRQVLVDHDWENTRVMAVCVEDRGAIVRHQSGDAKGTAMDEIRPLDVNAISSYRSH
eukprot:9467721-Pyramimonas_sp.AAC.1